jgi:digeranylgeranylglycerophospholipid reductase
MIKTDVLIIGSGPAGSSAAKYAALGGASVILIDKKSEIGTPKRCAEIVTKEGLESIGISPNPHWVTKKIDGVRLISPNGTNLLLNSGIKFLPEAGYILERKVFDKYMAMDAARAGSKIRVKTLAHEMKKKEDSYIVTCEHMGDLFEIKAKIIIAADGPESRVARQARLKTVTKAKNMGSAIQFEMCGVKMGNTNVIEVYIGSIAPGGYAWIFPKSNDVANVGLGVIAPYADKTAYQYLIEFVNKCPATQNAQAVELNIGGVPVGGMHEKIYADNLLVVGDAAGQVNPLIGGGITNGMIGGMHAGIVAAEAIVEKDYSEKRLQQYDKNVREAIGNEIDKCLKIKNFVFSLSDSELNSIAKTFKDTDFKKVNNIEIIKNLVKFSPKSLIKLSKLV